MPQKNISIGGCFIMKIDLNFDMGESFGIYTIGSDEEVIKFITSANVACGWHAGDPTVMRKTVAMAKKNGVGIGAHPSYPDLLGFGRRNMSCSIDEIRDYIIYQIGALQAFATAEGTKLIHVKPHGSLYSAAVKDEKVAKAIAEAIESVDKNLIFMALAGIKGEPMRFAGHKANLRVASEAFPDRAYASDGSLLSRQEKGAVIKNSDVVAERALMIVKENKIVAIDGKEIQLNAETLCVHGDTPGALNIVKKVRTKLFDEGIEVISIGKFL
jgi:UPF0271 protein